MMVSKFLLAACLFYVYSSLGEASLAQVSSLTNGVVQQVIAAHVSGHSRQLARLKREVVTKKLEDPKGCIASCRKNETKQTLKAVITNTAHLVALALEDLHDDDLDDSKGNDEAMKKRVEATTIKNMGPLFEDLCKVKKNAGLCYTKCPTSQTQSFLIIDNEGDQTAMCEPSRNWNNFSEYWGAMECINKTKIEKPCDEKCGEEQTVRNATKLNLSDDGDSGEDDEDEKESTGAVIIKYESDPKKNNPAAGAACKSRSCQMECYKAKMPSKCGAKANDMYNRMTKVEPHTSLGMLKVLKAIDSPDDCKVFQ